MCLNCNIFQVIPHLSKEELSKYYQDYGNLRPGYYSELRSNKRVIGQFNLIDKFSNLNKKNYLEYGSGNCIALKYVLDHYNLNTITSVDPSDHTNRICSTLDIKNYSDLNKLKKNSVDFIFTSHALEHLSSLKEFLVSIDTILSSKGELFVEVPNIPDENILKNRFHLPHTYAFNLKNFQLVCRKYGFRLKDENSFEFAEHETLRLILCRN
jgi:trans-aconitate methyltransferase